MYGLQHQVANMINRDYPIFGLEHIHSVGVHTYEGGDAETHYKTGHALAEQKKNTAGTRFTLEGVSEMSQDAQEAPEIEPTAHQGDIFLDG